MGEYIFVNNAFTCMIEDYLASKNVKEGLKYNSFLVVIFRQLCLIYDELDLLNPYYLKDESSLYINFEKYGYLGSNLSGFFNMLEHFYENENSSDFINIQKMVVDMFIKKKLSIKISDEDVKTFEELLYSPKALNPLQVSYNYMMCKNVDEVLNYYYQMSASNVKKEQEKPKEILNIEAYELLNYSNKDIENMDADEIEKVNKEVYSYFDINENAINKDYLLDKAVFDIKHPTPSYSTGNGYVDILFFLSILATIVLVIIILSIYVF